MKVELCVVDTMVLRKANAPSNTAPQERRDFVKRIRLLQRLQKQELKLLLSERLLHEYRQQVHSPRNDLVKAFFEMAANPSRRILNWPPWPGRMVERQTGCRFPSEDTHVLRTAYREEGPSTIFSEEKDMLKAEQCIYLKFRVHIKNPVAE